MISPFTIILCFAAVAFGGTTAVVALVVAAALEAFVISGRVKA